LLGGISDGVWVVPRRRVGLLLVGMGGQAMGGGYEVSFL
jgi:hypothetical protein